MRFATLQAAPQAPPCLTVWWDGAWRRVEGCRDFLDWLRLPEAERVARLAHLGEPMEPALYCPPILIPPSVRDFYAFEAHVRNARRKRGYDAPPQAWYEFPAFYFSNPACLVGHDQPVRKPPNTNALDFELELAVIIGCEGGDFTLQEAESAIAGFTLMNDWSARDIQMREMSIGLGPAKGKDFATSLGPWVVTPDELDGWRSPDPDHGSRWDMRLTARLNGQEITRASAGEMYWTFAEIIAHASRNTRLQVGDVIGSGTVGGGCLLEYPDGTYPWLQPGDTVELEAEGIGVLRNRIV
ncbi:MAG: fumarylacetoacetase [Armatimonadetes bacterium JP3_11]|nr:MAG: fumarylacetoacetase [Armatimonadetes bacterium JP3_11]RMH08862.1 MAG: fumarylacetoacetate hydrolase family protein [Armatimonadota bacterium]